METPLAVDMRPSQGQQYTRRPVKHLLYIVIYDLLCKPRLDPNQNACSELTLDDFNVKKYDSL